MDVEVIQAIAILAIIRASEMGHNFYYDPFRLLYQIKKEKYEVQIK